MRHAQDEPVKRAGREAPMLGEARVIQTVHTAPNSGCVAGGRRCNSAPGFPLVLTEERDA